jgi:hypothetical protein
MNEGDVFTTDLDALLDGVSAVVSTLGGFGSNEQMEKINAEANILAVNAAKRAGKYSSCKIQIDLFSLISSYQGKSLCLVYLQVLMLKRFLELF